MIRTVTAVMAMLTGASAWAQADAPFLEPRSGLSAQLLEEQELAIVHRASDAKVFKGVAAGGFVVGGLAILGVGAVSLSAAFTAGHRSDFVRMVHATTFVGTPEFYGWDGAPNYTPLLGAAVIGLSVGVISSIIGAILRSSLDGERDRLAQLRARLAEEASAAHWARIDPIAVEPEVTPEPEAPRLVPSAPPPPPELDKPRTPLRPR
jgi:hypothetical protein